MKADLKQFYKMNKIVPGGLMKLKKQSRAIRKARRATKDRLSKTLVTDGKQVLTSTIPVATEFKLDLLA